MAQVQHDKFGDQKFAEMYANHRTYDVRAFQTWCTEAVKNHSCSSTVKKDAMVRQIQMTSNKDKLVKMLTNFFLAGEGLSTVKI